MTKLEVGQRVRYVGNTWEDRIGVEGTVIRIHDRGEGYDTVRVKLDGESEPIGVWEHSLEPVEGRKPNAYVDATGGPAKSEAETTKDLLTEVLEAYGNPVTKKLVYTVMKQSKELAEIKQERDEWISRAENEHETNLSLMSQVQKADHDIAEIRETLKLSEAECNRLATEIANENDTTKKQVKRITELERDISIGHAAMSYAIEGPHDAREFLTSWMDGSSEVDEEWTNWRDFRDSIVTNGKVAKQSRAELETLCKNLDEAKRNYEVVANERDRLINRGSRMRDAHRRMREINSKYFMQVRKLENERDEARQTVERMMEYLRCERDSYRGLNGEKDGVPSRLLVPWLTAIINEFSRIITTKT